MTEIHAYLAGPDVFFSNAADIGEQKKAKLKAAGIVPHHPFDSNLGAPHDKNSALAIAKADENMMLDCCKNGRFGIIFANMTPFRSPSMDIGTGFEVGFMSALAEMKKNVVIIGYTDDPRRFEDRTIQMAYQGRVSQRDGLLFGSDGTMIEAYGGAENLMIVHAIEKTGGRIVASFDDAVALAQTLVKERLSTPSPSA